jgi:protein-tyrosine phosphatase
VNYDEAYDRLEALGEARELAGLPDAADDEYWEGTHIFLPKSRTSQITDNLWVGGGPWGGEDLPGIFTAVLDIIPSTPYIAWQDVTVRTVVMHDDWNQDMSGVDELAEWVNEQRKKGNVLVKCAAGLNRSGVVAARALMLGPEKLSAREALDLLRQKRDKLMVCNQMFQEWLFAAEVVDGA